MKKNLFSLKAHFILLFLFFYLFSTYSFAQWVEKSKALKHRSEVAGVVYNSKLYTFLGFKNSKLETESSGEVYDPATDTWTLLASLPEEVSVTHEGVALVDNTVWIVGGRVGQNPGPLTSNIWIYNITTNTWSPGPQLRDPATGEPLLWGAGGAVLLGRTLHIVGGFVINACNNDQSQYHLTLDVDSWLANTVAPAQWVNKLAPLPVKRNHFATTVLGGKIYCIGGQFGHDCKGGLDRSYSHVYDPATDAWAELPLLPSPRSHIEGGVFAIDGKIYIVAGQGADDVSTDKVTIFDPSGNNGAGSWQDDPSLTLLNGYEGVSAKVIGNTFIYSHGGQGSSYNARSATFSRTITRNPVYKLGFSSGCLHLNAQNNSSATGKTLLYTIDGSKDYTISSSADWLSVTKNAAGTATPNAVDIEVTANAANLAPGEYNAVITAGGTDEEPAYESATYCVTLTVAGTIASDTLQAETAILNGVTAAADHPDFSGTGFANYINQYDDYIQWSVNKSETGTALLQFRYSNGKDADRILKLEVNGVEVASNLSFPTTGSWNQWAILEIAVNLTAGINTVKLTATGQSGPNIDYVVINNNTTGQLVQRNAVKKSFVGKVSELSKVSVSPNPASGLARLVLSTSSAQPVHMEIIDMLGKIHQKMNFSYNNLNSFDFSVKDLPTGMYIVKVMQGKIIKSTKLIVKNRGLN